MYRAAINYKGYWLAPGSVAHRLHQDKKLGELDKHIKALDVAERQLLGSMPVLPMPAQQPA